MCVKKSAKTEYASSYAAIDSTYCRDATSMGRGVSTGGGRGVGRWGEGKEGVGANEQSRLLEKTTCHQHPGGRHKLSHVIALLQTASC